MQFSDLAKSFARKSLPDSEVEFTGEVPYEIVAPYEGPALKHIGEHLELQGFRKGKVPEDMARKKVGEIAILEDAVELFVQDFYPELVESQKLNAVGRPMINVTKLVPKNPVGLVIRVALYPEVTPPKDWKKINEKIPLEPYTGDLPKTDPMPSEEDQQKAREMLAHNQRRGKLIDALIEGTNVEVPKIFVESELEKIVGQLKEDVVRFGLKFEDYLKQINKSEEAVRDDFRAQALKRAKLQLTLNKIALDEKIEADKDAIEGEMKHALEHFPNANQALVRIHIETVLRNEKVLKLLEGNDKKE